MKKLITRIFLLFIVVVLFYSCNDNTKTNKIATDIKLRNEVKKPNLIAKEKEIEFVGDEKTIHILVALCDNKYQGIVPVAKRMGNGQNPNSNLYWGAGFGIKTFFKRSSEWTLIKTKNSVNDTILERVIFKHRSKKFYIVADAYNGKNIKETVIDFLKSVSGIKKDTLKINKKTLGINGNSSLIAYIGHNGLMDFNLTKSYKNIDNKERDAIILACISKDYFSRRIKDAKANPIVWTTGLMTPEAYTIHDAITAYINNKTDEQVRLKAAKAYSKYQKCSLNAANHLLVKGW